MRGLPLRQTSFGECGLVSFYADQEREVIRIFDVTWVG
jgi:hypothetical protein